MLSFYSCVLLHPGVPIVREANPVDEIKHVAKVALKKVEKVICINYGRLWILLVLILIV